MVWAQLWSRAGRTLALLLGILLATTGFSVLTGVSERSQLLVTETVQANARAAYDILVRPEGTRTREEADRDSVRPNHLSGLYGGITPEQWRTIADVDAVDVAAPIAMIGYAAALATIRVDLTDAIDPTADRQVIRLRPTWASESGLTAATEQVARFVYVTRHPVAPTFSVRSADGTDRYVLPDGSERPLAELARAGCTDRSVPFLYLEQTEDEEWAPICGTWYLDFSTDSGTASLSRSVFYVFQALPDGTYRDFTRVSQNLSEQGVARAVAEPRVVSRPEFQIDWPLWLSAAAVDPGAEARLVGLDRAVISGTYLSGATREPGLEPRSVPVLVPATAPMAERLSVTIERIGDPVAVPGVRPTELVSRLSAAAGVDRSTASFDAAVAYTSVLADPTALIRLDVTLQAAPPTYRSGANGGLRPEQSTVDPRAWQTGVSQFGESATGADAMQPYLASDLGFRRLSPTAVRPPTDVLHPPKVVLTGVFDASRLTEFPGLSVVPQETYNVPPVTGADDRTKSLLDDGRLPAGNNPAGYVAAPPSMLMSLDVARQLVSRPDLISAIRVRVAGVAGVDPVSRERVRLAAEEIATRTGLDVDVTVGSSPRPQLIELPAGLFGRPPLALHEGWSKKGVAVAIVRAADRKSLVLFGLILVVCLFFLSTALSAAVRDRHRELAILACLGWPAWRRAALILTEVGLVGLLAGALSAGTSYLMASALELDFSWQQSLVAVPVALTVTTVAGAVPAVRAGRAHPAEALYRAAVPGRRTGQPRGVVGLAMTNVVRSPGRALLGAMSLAAGVAGVLVLLAVLWIFDGAVVGTLLGDAVSIRVRAVDIVAVTGTVVLGGFAVADVLYLNVRERASEFALLQASGWPAGAVGRLVMTEATIIGLAGGVLGAGIGLLGLATLGTGLPPQLIPVAALVCALAIGSAVLAGVVPALSLRRASLTRLLAEE